MMFRFQFCRLAGVALGVMLGCAPLTPLPASAQEATASIPSEVGPVTGLAMPRFAALTRDEVNVRTGPGERYPIDWVFIRKHMPVQIVGEYEHWRKIRDFEGVEGWVHKVMLSGQKTVMFVKGGFLLRREPSFSADPVVKVEQTVTGSLGDCADGWCLVEVGGFKGWSQTEYLWGITPAVGTES
jgi:SH3-like domain-containing protein